MEKEGETINMTNWLTPENFKIYIEHLNKIDDKIEEKIMSKELKKSIRQRKYLKYLVLPE